MPQDDPSVRITGPAARWRALFRSEPPRAAWLVEQAIAWQEQALAQGDVAPATLRDLAIAARQASEGRGAGETPPVVASCSIPSTADAPAPARANAAPCSMSAEQDGADAVPCDKLPAANSPAPARSVAPPRTRSRASRAAPVPLPPASSQLLPGTRLVKSHGGRNHVVEVTATGFTYQDQAFASLSAVAKHITGTHWNGLLFFGLRRRKTYPARVASGG